MATPISALEHQPSDFIREVSLDAINFYADGLSGLYLPDDFKQAHDDVADVKYWEPKDRFRGKFGRFTLLHTEGVELDDILLMGTTIGLSGLDHYGNLESLRHYSFQGSIRAALEERDLLGKLAGIDKADYGDTTLVIGEDGSVDALKVSGSSIEFGRAKADGRLQTCKVFERLLGDAITVINEDPEPKSYEQIIS